MRAFEFVTIKPRKPLTLAQARIEDGKKRVDQAKDALKRERDTQRIQKDNEQRRKALSRR